VLIPINARILLFALCILVIDAEKIDRSWSTYTLSRRSKWRRWTRSPKEKQRLGEALARLDAERGKLVSQLSELEATEHGARALQHGYAGTEDVLSQNADHGSKGGVSSETTPAIFSSLARTRRRITK
jgi:hypothetical protein